MRGVVIAAFLLAPEAAYALACSSSSSGNWTAPGTWSSCGGGVPGNGDTATIAHAVTLNANVTVGTSPATDAAVITINNGGRIVWGGPFMLTVRGGIRIANETTAPPMYKIDVGPGGGLQFDPSQAPDRTTAVYTLQPAASNSGSIIRFACSGASPCTLRTLRPNGDEARAYFEDIAASNANFIDATHVNISDLGSATQPAFEFRIASSAPQYGIVSFQWCDFNNVGEIGIGSINADDHVIRFNHNRYRNGLTTGSWPAAWSVGFGFNIIEPGVREIVGNVAADRGLGTNLAMRDVTIRDNFFRRTRHAPTSGSTLAALVTNNLFGMDMTVEGNASMAVLTTGDNWHNNYMIWRNLGNPHLLSVNSTGIGNVTVRDSVFEVDAVSGDGDVILKNQGDNDTNYTITNNLFIPGPANFPNAGFNILTFLCGSGIPVCGNWYLFKNTIFGAGDTHRAIIAYNENAGVFGRVQEARSNIAGAAGGTLNNRGIMQQTVGGAGQFLPGGISHNGSTHTYVHNAPGTSSHGTKYNIVTASGDPVPGQNDLYEEAKYVDAGRSAYRFAAMRGYANSWPGLVALFEDEWAIARQTSDTTRIANLIAEIRNWVRQGYAPRNLRYATGGHDGGRIGAVPVRLMFGAL